MSANHKALLLPPRPRGLEHGDLAPGPGQGHRHAPQVGHHDVGLGRGGLAQTLQVLKPLGLDRVALLKVPNQNMNDNQKEDNDLEMFKFCGPPELWCLDTFPDADPRPDLSHEEAVLLDLSHLDRHHSVDIVIIIALSKFDRLFLLDRKRKTLSGLNLLCLTISHSDTGMAEGFL